MADARPDDSVRPHLRAARETIAAQVTNSRVAVSALVNSRACQAAGVVIAFLSVAMLHRESDGLWFQGDAPRHAVNGLFWWDLLTTLPRDPVAFAVSYYARYPVIAPATYPPIFYIVEGLAFAAFGRSPYVAKAVVVVFGCVAGLYTMAWGRRWIGAPAGWTGAFLAFVPGIALWSNTVMLNVPATALGVASLYYFRRWLETAGIKPLVLAICFSTAVLLTYYPGGSVLCILGVWALPRIRDRGFDRRLWWIPAAALMAAVPLLTALLLAPVHTARQLPTIALLTSASTWAFYWRALPNIVGGPALALGTTSLAAVVGTKEWRAEAAYVGSWILVLVFTLSLLPAKDSRYALLAAPAFTLAAAMGVAWVARRLPPLAPPWPAGVLAASLAVGLWSAARIQVPQVSGFREIADYLRERAPADAVLYDGPYDGLFGFHVRASDPNFERRFVLGNKLLYESGPTKTFKWVQKSNVSSTDDVVNLLRTRSGCRWIAIEVDDRPVEALGRRLLLGAVERSEFELVRSFPISGAGNRRVDLYRVVGDIDPVTTVDLSFPSLTNREFLHITPIVR
jgi:hypothetical protein